MAQSFFPSGSFTRPANTTAYAEGDLVANSATAGSVEPVSLDLATPSGLMGWYVRRIRFSKSGTSTTNASFRVHLYSSSPTPANGDNGAYSTDEAASYLGALDVTVGQAFTDGAVGVAVPNAGNEINVGAGSGAGKYTIYALVEARGAYTPGSGEVFTLAAEIHPY